MIKLDTVFNEFHKLETERFILREVVESDYTAIYDIYCNEDAVKYQQIKAMSTIEAAKKSVEFFIDGFKNKKFIRWCITLKENDDVIGLITLHDFDTWNSKVEIGYMLNKKYWGQNIMSEVSKKIIQYAFEVLELNRIEALVDPENIISIKLNIKLGFVKEGLKKGAAYNRRTEKYEDRLMFGIVNNLVQL
ncbi:GNAT family N-acetyltransferase [Clostridium sp. CF012]|uniref:GNAT family N-acetyltransferase n=1 Tax=Clostridium sp. CF012 TaxID=2843319 RepID=UPI001C0E01C7|nr:GNAT family N-acetyltransferase [Clostridium sp. CF012]MBU3145969.1 GNAT family N-acetyltransferase [Clostridium sp. CF012]